MIIKTTAVLHCVLYTNHCSQKLLFSFTLLWPRRDWSWIQSLFMCVFSCQKSQLVLHLIKLMNVLCCLKTIIWVVNLKLRMAFLRNVLCLTCEVKNDQISNLNYSFSSWSFLLECEVKWALGSSTMNKACGGDGIPVELFQILKDDAVKVLHSKCQQIWKTQQWPQDWKRSVFIPIPKAMPKNAQTTAQFHSSHMLVK